MAEDKQPHRSRFHKAKDDAQFAKQATTTPQTAHPAYKLAFQDTDFLLREDLRPVRFQLELLKPELLLDEAGIESTLVRSEEHTSELQSLMRISYAVFCLKKKQSTNDIHKTN